MSDLPLLVLGATGRIGGAMRALDPVAGLLPVWQSRAVKPGFLAWDILAEPCPNGAATGVVLCLAGVIRGSDSALALNEALALAACRAATVQGARHVFLVSSAAVYAPSDGALHEDLPLFPPAPYGKAKAAMERAALAMMPLDGPGLTILRIGNIAGFDALLGGMRADVQPRLDPVEGQDKGPVRSYIGPVTLARLLMQLAELAAWGIRLPRILNIAAAPVAMGDLLDAAAADWAFGPDNLNVIPRVELDITRLKNIVDLPSDAGQAAVMVGEWQGLKICD